MHNTTAQTPQYNSDSYQLPIVKAMLLRTCMYHLGHLSQQTVQSNLL